MYSLLVQRVLAIVGLGVIIGGADSWIRPATISLKLPAPVAQNSPSPVPAAPSPTVPAAPKADAESIASSKNPVVAEKSGAAAAPQAIGLMIDAKTAKKLFDDGVVFLDARIEAEYKAGHVPQAFHLNSQTFGTPAAADAMKALDPAQPAVIYCGGGDCDASKNLAILLQGAGYTKLHIFEAGFPDWEKHGFPVEKEKP